MTRAARTIRLPFAALCLTLSAWPAAAGIAGISAHGKTFGPTAEIPVFVDPSERTKIVVKGPLMDLATGVSSSDSRYPVSLGRRIAGGNSSIEVLVGVSDTVRDGDESTIRIHFLVGEERLKVKTFRSRIDRMEIEPPRAGDRFLKGEKVILLLHGQGLDRVDSRGAVAVMLRAAAGNLCKVEGPLAPGSTATRAAFQLELTGTGTLWVTKDWFRDARHQSPVGEALVRGNPRPVRLVIEARPKLVGRRDDARPRANPPAGDGSCG